MGPRDATVVDVDASDALKTAHHQLPLEALVVEASAKGFFDDVAVGGIPRRRGEAFHAGGFPRIHRGDIAGEGLRLLGRADEGARGASVAGIEGTPNPNAEGDLVVGLVGAEGGEEPLLEAKSAQGAGAVEEGQKHRARAPHEEVTGAHRLLQPRLKGFGELPVDGDGDDAEAGTLEAGGAGDLFFETTDESATRDVIGERLFATEGKEVFHFAAKGFHLAEEEIALQLEIFHLVDGAGSAARDGVDGIRCSSLLIVIRHGRTIQVGPG